MHIARAAAAAAAVASLVALTATGCAASSEPDENQDPAVVVNPAEKDPQAPAVETGAVSPEARREVCRWMTCRDVNEPRPYRCYVCY